MTLRPALMFVALAVTTVANAATSSDRTSQVDRNAACMDRTVDASTGKCVVNEDGTPRHTYPPKSAAPVVTPHTGATAPAPAVRGSGTAR